MLRVFLPGTGTKPLDYSCMLKSVGEAAGDGPLIGLSYAWLPVADAGRNQICATQSRFVSSATAECLSSQHVE